MNELIADYGLLGAVLVLLADGLRRSLREARTPRVVWTERELDELRDHYEATSEIKRRVDKHEAHEGMTRENNRMLRRLCRAQNLEEG